MTGLPRRLGALDRADTEPAGDDRPTRFAPGVMLSGGNKSEPACKFRRHPLHPNERICELCGSTVGRAETGTHERNHRYEAQWEDKIELLEAQLEAQAAEFAEIRGEWGMLVDLLHPRIQRMMDGQDDASG